MLEFTGKLISTSIDWESGKPLVTFLINEGEEFKRTHEQIVNEQIDIKVGKHRKKRSLDANGMLWALCGEIAIKQKTSREEVYEKMLNDYGTFYKDEEGYVVATVPSKVDAKNLPGHWKPYKTSPDGKFTSYMMIKGSSEYDTAEMSRLLDGVIYEAKELGIRTETPEEIRKMKERWGV